MMEEWRNSVANYEVSSMGRMRRSTAGRKTFAGRILKQQLLQNGYFSVRPTVDGRNKQFYTHDLIAAAFNGPKPEGAHVNHKDGMKTNNAPSNLEYTSRKGNMEHAAVMGLMARGESHPQRKLDDERVRQLRADRGAGLSFSQLARKHGVSIATAFNAANGHSWAHVL